MTKGKNYLYIVCAFILGVLLTVFIMIACYSKASKYAKEYILEYGDSFKEVKILDTRENSVNLEENMKEYTFVFYVDKNCRACLNSLETISQINKIYSDKYANVVILWENEIELNYAKKKGIPIENNYKLDKAYINTVTPTCYILDSNLNIIFCGVGIEDMIKKIKQLDIPMDEIHNAVNRNIIEPIIQAENKENKKVLVYFSMIGCPDCEAAEKVINSSDIQKKYNIVTLYRDRENVPMEKQSKIDHSNLLSKLYDIVWYPSFLVIDEDDQYKQIGETSIAELKKQLLY